ncbi:MAG: T9SS C-terminal target domain-containing protein [Bacteroidetes bacterium]|nr:MAG: T9SS C-terminal target domain-containing protein [Bacteroidota bacterium]REK00952.1 MAG: T9SS C-terminal target domain-containing protein [Bacteroidota bacterium]REK34555.1 MAG: T9SS C-terminal target domain-containing protein [Bacteroidota bacterium]
MKIKKHRKNLSYCMIWALSVIFILVFTGNTAARNPKKHEPSHPSKEGKLNIRINIDRHLSKPGSSDAIISAEIMGGTAPYQLNWSNGSTTASIENLSSGLYTVTVTDTRGLSARTSIDLRSIPCGEGDCRFRTQTQGGWGSKPNGNNPGQYLQRNFNSAFPDGLTIGCTNKLYLSSADQIRQFLPSGTTPSVLPSGILSDPGSGYKNVLAGQIVALTLSVGFDNFDADFSASNSRLENLVVKSGLFSGKTVKQILSEANKAIGGCSSAYTLSQLNAVLSAINENFVDGQINNGFLECNITNMSIAVNSTNESCLGACDGRASLIINGGTSPYFIQWSDNSDAQNLSGLCHGEYSVTIQDQLGCSASTSFVISSNSSLNINATSTDISCHGLSDGVAEATIESPNQTYHYQWSPGGQRTRMISNLSRGTYTVRVTDMNDCSATASVTVNEPLPLSQSFHVTNASCHDSNGSITAVASGGTAPYTYYWVNEQTTGSTLSNKPAGFYPVLISDSRGCTSSKESIIQGNDVQLSVNAIIHTNCPYEENGEINISATGGIGPYSYTWYPYGGIGPHADNLIAGHYIIRVDDANGCPAYISATVESMSDHCYPNYQYRIKKNVATNQSISLSPNPAETYTTIILNGLSHEFPEITVYDSSGRLLENSEVKSIAGNSYILNTANFSSGIYFIKVTTIQKSEMLKLIRQ